MVSLRSSVAQTRGFTVVNLVAQKALSLVAWFVFLVASTASGTPPSQPKIPSPLKPWAEWVLYGHEDSQCPSFFGNDIRRQCIWPSRLHFTLDEKGGRFSQEWLVHIASWVALPGNEELWPHEVTVDGKSAVVLERNGSASVYLSQGQHTVRGQFRWTQLPEMLPVPKTTGLLSLELNGKEESAPNWDKEGRLWLEGTIDGQDTTSDSLEVVVHRKLVDEVPLLIVTHIELRVSGKNRQVELAHTLPEGTVPMAILSPLPARIESEGELIIQVRPGTWIVEVEARQSGPVTVLKAPSPTTPWDTEEVWVFDARPALRLVDITGVPAIDPLQTTLPEEWKRFPAYLVRGGNTMNFSENRRGNDPPSPDKLELDRTLWLDFDGRGYTVHDRVTGSLSQSWRLEMGASTDLGRVSVMGVDQFVTELTEDGPQGVEIRHGAIQLKADSRMKNISNRFSAVGWNHDFQKVSAKIHLPPGWTLIHATGVDQASPSWVERWTLLDLFLVLIFTLATAKLWGWRWGLVAFATLALTYLEPEAPRWSWLFVAGLEALRRVLPEGRIHKACQGARYVFLAILILLAIPFMIREARLALHPALERPYQGLMHSGTTFESARNAQGGFFDGNEDFEVAQMKGAAHEEAPAAPPPQASEQRPRKKKAPKQSSSILSRSQSGPYFYGPDPNALVSTGAGLTDWSWNIAHLSWQGPVSKSQEVHLALLSPTMNLVLGFIRVFLVLLLILGFLGGIHTLRTFRKKMEPSDTPARAASALLFIVSLLLPAPARAEFPSSGLLQDLQTRLLAKPECHPECAASSALKITVERGVILGRMSVSAASETTIPLPTLPVPWTPSEVLLDAQEAKGLVRNNDGQLWLWLSPGVHTILFRGPEPDSETLQFSLPLKPHRVEVHAPGWRIEGLHNDGIADDHLQLTRIQPATGPDGQENPSPQDALPPFVRVERTLRFGLSWRIHTRIVRQTPPGVPVVLEIPLLAGESVTTANTHVVNGRMLVNMPPDDTTVEWSSVIKEQTELTLRAPETMYSTEVWRLDVSPLWHVETQGAPPIHQKISAEARIREWQPWPSEQLSLRFSRPGGAGGQTLTIDRAKLIVTPGIRSTRAALSLTARSSRGIQHAIILPEEGTLESLSIDNRVQPIQQEGRSVVLSIAPGKQSIALSWTQPGGIKTYFVSPKVDIGRDSVNVETHIELGRSRWPLWVSAPGIGPAVLFWSLLLVFSLVSLGLGQIRSTPLRWFHWLLLGLGLTQGSVWVAAPVVAWFLILGERKKRPNRGGPIRFNLQQMGLVLLTLIAMACLFGSIRRGLLGLPEMQILGNASSAHLLKWYQDRSGTLLPQATVFSFPLVVYRIAMLAWAMWLAAMMLRWLRWGWACFSTGGIWQKMTIPTKPKRRASPAPKSNPEAPRR